MNRVCRLGAMVPAAVLLLLAGCGDPKQTAQREEHGGHADAASGPPVRFKRGQGIELAPETAASLGISTASIERRTLAQRHEIGVAVFDAGPPARASALVPPEVADDLEGRPPPGAEVLGVRRDLSTALAQVEVILAVPGSPAVGSTLALPLRSEPRTVLAVPSAAVLRSAIGTFVYTVNGRHLLRTPVKAGAGDGSFVEILEGLYAGDEIVTAGVEQLWLTELRLTKGGGHTH